MSQLKTFLRKIWGEPPLPACNKPSSDPYTLIVILDNGFRYLEEYPYDFNSGPFVLTARMEAEDDAREIVRTGYSTLLSKDGIKKHYPVHRIHTVVTRPREAYDRFDTTIGQ